MIDPCCPQKSLLLTYLESQFLLTYLLFTIYLFSVSCRHVRWMLGLLILQTLPLSSILGSPWPGSDSPISDSACLYFWLVLLPGPVFTPRPWLVYSLCVCTWFLFQSQWPMCKATLSVQFYVRFWMSFLIYWLSSLWFGYVIKITYSHQPSNSLRSWPH